MAVRHANPTTLTPAERALLAQLPDPPAAVRVRRPEQGIDNTVAIVDDEWVVRRAETDAARDGFDNEVAVLRALVDHRSPQPQVVDGAGMVYPFRAGRPLDRATWDALDEAAQCRAAADLRSVLEVLHLVPQSILTGPLDVLDTAWAAASIVSCAAIQPRRPLHFDPNGLLDRFQHAWAEGEVEHGIIHVDLKPANLVFDGARASVIDFGGISVGDPAIDFGVLTHHFGDAILERMGLAGGSLAARARCYADLYHLRRSTKGWTRSAPRYRADPAGIS